jgi:hypothetical protein
MDGRDEPYSSPRYERFPNFVFHSRLISLIASADEGSTSNPIAKLGWNFSNIGFGMMNIRWHVIGRFKPEIVMSKAQLTRRWQVIAFET